MVQPVIHKGVWGTNKPTAVILRGDVLRQALNVMKIKIIKNKVLKYYLVL